MRKTILIFLFAIVHLVQAQVPTFEWGHPCTFSSIVKMVTDENHLYITGYLNDTADFDVGPGTFTLGPSNSSSHYYAKYDFKGKMIWAVKLDGKLFQSYDIVLDANSNLLIGGFFKGTIDFDPDSSVFNLSSSSGTIAQNNLSVN